jgi:hypothetical protein
MQLNEITFKPGDEGAIPDRVTVTLTIREAAYITTIVGKQDGPTAEAFMRGGAEENYSLYDGFTSDVFNRYWDDGLDGARQEIQSGIQLGK